MDERSRDLAPLARGVRLGVVGLVVLCAAGSALAEVEGTAPTKVNNWRLYGSHSALGSALMVPGPSYAEINSVMLSSATSQVTDLPFDAEVVAAYLFWSASSPRNNGNRSGNPDPPDRDVDFTVADGTSYNDLSIDTDYTGFGRCVTVPGLGGFYYCRRDVTDIIRLQGPGNANGIYRIGDMLADAGTLNSGDPQWVNAQAKYAGWSLILVWRSSTQTVRRDVVLYDGFLRLDETQTAAGWYTFNIGDFLVGSPPLGKLSVFGMEGDRQLGVPPQDSTGCPTCWDFISFKSNTAGAATVLSNGLNPAYNSFNSSTDTSIDIDTYDLNGLIRTADNSATITVGAGDGIVDPVYNQGNGESFNVGWVIMTIDTLTPNFGGTQTRKRVLPINAGPGQRLYYSIDVVNEGSLAATNVIVQDAVPAGSRYVAGSTRVDGVSRADVGGTSPLVAGLNLGSIPTSMAGDNSRQVTFEVEVLAAACGGAVENYATVRSSETDPTTVGPARTTVATPTLDPPTKAVSFISPAPIGPGAAFSYTIDINNAGAQPAAGVKIVDPLPLAMKVSSVLATSGTWSQVGNTLTVTDIGVPANGSAQVVVVGRVLTVAEFVAAGIPESTLDGLIVSNQATVSGGCTADQLTDDPDVGGFQATVFSLTYGPVLSSSTKTGVDLNGGRLEPNDTIRYSINVVNTGNRVADVVVRDAMPANTTYVPGSTRVDGVAVPDVAGASALVVGYTLVGVAYVGDNDRLVTFDVTVDALAPNGLLIANTAHLEVPAAPTANRDVTSTTLRVVAAPDLSTSTKTVADLTAPIGTWMPGDAVTYTLTVSNTGNRPATNVVVRDTFPADLIFVSADNGGAYDGTSVVWPAVPSIAAGASRVFTIQATLKSPLDSGRVVVNVGHITCAELPETLVSVSFAVTSSPRLTVTKIDDHPSLPPKPGDAVTYRIRLQNDGTMAATNVVVTDNVDASLRNISAPTGSLSGSRVTWSAATDPRLASLGLGAANAVELTLGATIITPLSNGTSISNQATATPSGFPAVLSDDPDVGGITDPTVFTVVSQAILTFTKAVQDLTPLTPYQPGDRVRYTLVVTGGGDAPIRDLSINDTLPATLTALDAGMSNGSVVGNTVTWSASTGAAALSRLNPGQTATLIVEATIAAGTTDGTFVDNQATGTSADLSGPIQSDGDAGTPGAQPTRFQVVSKPFLTLAKTVALVGDANGEFNPGDTIVYTLVLTNSGTAPATGATLADIFDGRLAILDAAGGTAAGQTVTWALGTLAPGASQTLAPRLKIAFPLDNDIEISNQASASSTEIPGPLLSDDPALPGLTDPTRFKIKSAPDFTKTTKSVRDLTGDPLVTRPGDTLEYTVIVHNDGNSDADQVVVDDVVPSETTVTVPANARFDGTKLTWDVASGVSQFGRLAAGASVSLVFTVTVKTPLANGTRVSNQAYAVSDEVTVPVPSDDPATVALDDPTVVTVVSAADLGGSLKSVTNLSGTPITTARPNDSVRYTLTVTNRGDATATNVVVTDVLDASLTFVSAATGRFDAPTGSVTWDSTGVSALASVAPLASVTLLFDAKLKTPLDNGLVIPNQGSIRATGIVDAVLTDADPSTLAKEETVLTVVSSPDLVGSTKIFVNPTTGAALTQARPGDAVRMLITLINRGDAIARNVNVADTVDTTLLTNVAARDGGSFAGGVATWTVAQVVPGTNVQLRLDARLRTPLDPTTLVNQALMGVGGPPAVPTDDPAQPGVADPTRLPIVSSATLDLSTKDVTTAGGGRTVGPGDTFSYTIDIKNTGDANARNVVLHDPLSSDLIFVSATGGGVYDMGTHAVSWSLPVVPGGGHAAVTLTVQVKPATPNGRTIDNRGELTADGLSLVYTDDPRVPTPDTATRVTVVALPSLASFQKRVELLDEVVPGLLRPGDRLRYTLTLHNDGNAVATNVEVRDLVDPRLLSDAQPGTPFQVEGNELVFNASTVAALASMVPGASVDLVFIAKVAAGVADGTAVPNQGFATTAELVGATPSDDPNTAAALDPTVVTVRYPQLVVTKSVTDTNGGDVEPGDSLAFTIKVANRGSFPADAVTLTDTVDAGLTNVVAPGAVVAGSTLTWTLGSIGAASEISVGFTAKVSASAVNGTTIRNKATAGTTLVPAVTSNEVSVTVVSIPRLDGTTKSVSSVTRQVAPGELLIYTIDIPNAGRAVATNTRVIDVVDSNLEIVSADSGGLVNGQTVTWQLGSLAIGDHRVLKLTARVRAEAPDAARVPNQALVTANELTVGVRSDDPTTAEVDDPTIVTVFAEPTFVKSTLVANDLNGGKAAAGDRIRYELKVLNSGTAKGNEVAVRMPMPPYVQYVPGSTKVNGVTLADTATGMPLADGFSVSSARAGTGPGVVLADDGVLPQDEVAAVSFEVQIDPRAVPGTVVSGQVMISSREAPLTPSDNPATPGMVGDPTVFVVGGGPELLAQKTARLVRDANTNAHADIGDTLRYTILVTNAGDAVAPGAVLTDHLPTQGTYAPATLTLDGLRLTDSPADDNGEVGSDGLVTVRLGDLSAGASRTVTVDLTINAGPWLANQAEVAVPGRVWLSDGDPTVPGAQPTVTAVDVTATVLGVTLTASDLNGGVVDAGDRLSFALEAVNQGDTDVSNIVFSVARPTLTGSPTIVESGAATVVNPDPPAWNLALLKRGERIRLVFETVVAADAVIGGIIETHGDAVTTTASFETDKIQLTVGGGVGSGGFSGKVFRDKGSRDGQYTEGVDELVPGFSVMLVPESKLAAVEQTGGEAAALSVRTVVADKDGSYAMPGVPPGRYELWLATSEGVTFARTPVLEVKAGSSVSQNLAIDPSGIIYQEVDGAAVAMAGARVFLVDFDTAQDLPRASVFGGQQGQVTTGQGFYRFDVVASALPRKLYVRVEPPSTTLVFPSASRPPQGGTSQSKWGDPASAPADGRIVESDVPDLTKDTHYFLRFDLSQTSPNFTNNHIPIDRLDQHLKIVKQASRRTAQLGEVVTYTVRITNPLDQGFAVDGAGQGGVWLVDDLPEGMQWAKDEASVVTTVPAGTGSAQRLGIKAKTARTIIFNALSLPAHSTVTVRYYLVVGIRAKGEQKNRARLVDAAGNILSNETSATVRIVEDPIFDQGTILGRVFCDDGDGEIGADDPGLPGARVFLDTGYFVDTDIEGKFHFRGVPAGRHLLKLDLNTVPVGSQPTTDVRRDFYLSRGLLTKINFGVKCGWESVRPTHVTLKHPPPPPPLPTVVVSVAPALPGISLNGTAQPLPLVDAVLTLADGAPNFASGEGMNLAGPAALTWNLQASTRVRIERWEVSVFTPEGTEVWRVAGEGRPPARVPWELTDDNCPFEAGKIYVYRIVARTPEGDMGEGVWRRLGYRFNDGQAPPAASGPPVVWNGMLFDAQTDKPQKLLTDKVKEFMAAAKKAGPLPALTVEAHSYFNKQRSANLLLSQRQAVAVVELLVKAGYPKELLKAVGRGDVEPLMPNVSRKAREVNRRVVLRSDLRAALKTGPLPPLAYAGFLFANEEMGDPSVERVEYEIPVEEGTRVSVDLRQANGRRLTMTRTYPFETAPTTERPNVELMVFGSLTGTDVTLGADKVPLPLLAAECGLAGDPPRLGDKGLDPPARFQIKAGVGLRSWLIRILNPEGTVLTDLTGEGAPPENVEWGGTGATGAVVVRPATYTFRCLLTDADGNRTVSARQILALDKGATKPVYSKLLGGDLYPKVDGLQPAVMTELDKAVAVVKTNPGASVRVEVHDSAEGGKAQAQVRSARLAAVVKTAIVMRGIDEKLVDAAAFGAARPLMPGTSKKAAEMNRRVLVEVSPPPPLAGFAELPATPHAKIAGVELPVAVDGTFTGKIVTEPDAALTVDLLGNDNRSAVYTIPLFDGRPADVPTLVVPRGFRPAAEELHIGSEPSTLMSPPRPAAGGDPGLAAIPGSGGKRPDLGPTFRASIDGSGEIDAVSGFKAGMPEHQLSEPSSRPRLVAPSGRPRLISPSGPPHLVEPSGPPGTTAAEVAAEEAIARRTAAEQAAAVEEPETPPATVPLDDAPTTSAADLYVWLPPDGATLKGERLAIRGRSDFRNVVRINGEQVAIDEYGRFFKTMVLKPGEARIDVIAEDSEGNTTEVLRTYRVPDWEWFLLAMGDGVAGWGNKLEGMNADTTWDSSKGSYPDSMPVELYLHGRAVGYFKGRVKGSALFAKNPFEEVRLTAHVDTGKPEDQDLMKQLIDPERYYPVYGDAAEETQDVTSRSKVYVLLEADKSRLIVGNFKTELDGIELFRFHRSYFGASLDLDKEFVPGFRTEAHALAASGTNGVRHRQVLLQGTGGSMYFLKDGEIVEGSERIEIVVRDAITGQRLASVPQSRDVTYNISYREGRVIFTEPVPSAASAGWRLTQNNLRTLDGNPIFVQVEYDYNAPALDNGEKAYGFQARQSVGERVTVGAGVVTEDRTASGGSKYELYGVDARARLSDQMRLTAELAYSQAQDAEHLVSFDGGVTYGQLGSPQQYQDNGTGVIMPTKAHGWAGKLTLAGDLGEFVPRPAAVPESSEFLPYNLYFQYQDPYFYSGNSILEQGQTKVGGQVKAVITETDSIKLRHDGVWSRLFLATEERRVDRQLTTATYEHVGDGWKAGAEAGNTFWDDGTRAITTQSVAGFGEKKVLPRLTLLGQQELILRGDPNVVDTTGDHFVTTAGARYQLGETVFATATESVRWSGTNSATLGLKTGLMDDFNVYANERVTTDQSRTVSTSVIGGESTAIPGSRSYGEYQLDSLASGRSGRAVFGMDNKWEILEGLRLNLSYERAQLVGNHQGTLTGALGSAVNDRNTTGYGSTALGRDQNFTASGYSSSGVFPVGVSSRDAFAVGLDFLRAKTFKASTRFEMRYDRGDANLGAHDRLVLFGQAGGDWRLDRYLVVLGRLQGATVQNLDYQKEVNSSLGFAEGQFMDISVGVALRPVHTDVVNGLFKWTRRYERRPTSIELTQFQLEVSDVVSLEEAFEVGHGVQLVTKVATKLYEVQDADLPSIRSTTLLTLARVNYHLTDMFDAGAEYRWLGNFLTDESEHGPLVEVAWIPVEYVAVGVGYNFTHYADDLLADPRVNQHGFFLRVTARY